MKCVKVRGADGSVVNLGLVRADAEHASVCPLSKIKEVEAGDERSVVVFPIGDVQIEPAEYKVGHA